MHDGWQELDNDKLSHGSFDVILYAGMWRPATFRILQMEYFLT